MRKPRWFVTLFLTDMWERFSFFGMIAILALYAAAPPANGGLGLPKITALALFGAYVGDIPSVYIHPHDPDDSHYVDLAIATNSTLIVSRDRHLLNLMDDIRIDGREL